MSIDETCWASVEDKADLEDAVSTEVGAAGRASSSVTEMEKDIAPERAVTTSPAGINIDEDDG